jgi:glycosyltransferase involved in cell wall biosynthesis
MKDPAVSVVIPAFNAATTIAEALASVRAQTFTDYEVIVVDDASTDNTVAIAEHESSNLPNHRTIALPSNVGPAAARNAGIRAARGTWIAFLDGDDKWLPWKLELQCELADAYRDYETFCGTAIALGESAPAPHVGIRSGARRILALRDFAIRNEVATSTVLTRKQAIEDAGFFDEQFRGPEDYDLWIRLAGRRPILKLDYPVSEYRHVEGSLSRDDMTFLSQVLRVLGKAYSEGGALHGIPARRRAVAYQYLCAAWMAAERAAHRRALALFAQSLLHWPFSFEPYLLAPWVRTKLLAGLLRTMTSRKNPD